MTEGSIGVKPPVRIEKPTIRPNSPPEFQKEALLRVLNMITGFGRQLTPTEATVRTLSWASSVTAEERQGVIKDVIKGLGGDVAVVTDKKVESAVEHAMDIFQADSQAQSLVNRALTGLRVQPTQTETQDIKTIKSRARKLVKAELKDDELFEKVFGVETKQNDLPSPKNPPEDMTAT